MIEQRFITARRHPTEPLTIYNYTTRAQIEGEWNEETRQCRGLIVHDDGRIIARPYSKFFNVGEPQAEVPPTFEVLDKLDGSLGITYRCADGTIRISTRGSFESDQAKHASAVWAARYADVVVPEGQTWLFEIIFPANRIVLNYGDLDDLVMHGCVDNATGANLPLPAEWPGPRVEALPCLPIDELLKMSKPNAEGFVLREKPAPVDRPARHVKVKLADYQRLHKIVSGLTPRRLWEALAAGTDIGALLDGAPDEFYREAMAGVDKLRADHAAILAEVEAIWAAILTGTPPDRKSRALEIQRAPEAFRPLLFCKLSEKSPDALIWKSLEPSGAIKSLLGGDE